MKVSAGESLKGTHVGRFINLRDKSKNSRELRFLRRFLALRRHGRRHGWRHHI